MKLKLNLAILLILLSGITFAQRNTIDKFTPVTITGNITEVSHPIANFKSEDGTVYQIHMGPYWYWLDNGYKLNNETATITGEVKTVNGVNELYPVEVSQNSTTIKLTDEKGIPLWANGNGRGWNNSGNRGWGWNNTTCKYDSVKCANCTNPGSCCNGTGCKYGKGNGNGNGNCWRNGNGKGNNGNGNCWRNSGNNNNSNNGNGNCWRNGNGNGNGRGWNQNCPNRTK